MAARNTPSLIETAKQFGTEEQCVAYLESMRWPGGVRCVLCDGDKISKFTTPAGKTFRKRKNRETGIVEKVECEVPARILYQCLNSECGHQFSPTSGTIFHDSHLPLSQWFLATALVVNAKKGLSAKQMERDLGVSYPTAWYLYHRIREAMNSGHGLFEGGVELDETFIGGKYNPRGKRQRYAKQPVMGIVQRGSENQSKQVQAFLIPNRSRDTLEPIIQSRVAPSARIFTDEWSGYRHLDKTHDHAIVIHTKGEYVRGDAHTNNCEIFWSLVKRQIIGQHHFVSVKHLQRYLNEITFRFNHRDAENLFALVLLQLVAGSPLRRARLTAHRHVVGRAEETKS